MGAQSPFSPPNQPVQHNNPHLQQVSLFPVEEREALAAFIDGFPEALDLAFTNPPLAVALANAQGWDTFGLVRVDRAFISGLLRQRRRRICGALGYPSSERVVRILAKVQTQACRVNLLVRVRSSLRKPEILSIFSHLPTVSAAQLRVAADLGNVRRVSPALFENLATQFTRESEDGWGRLLRQIETVLYLRPSQWRPFRSVQKLRRSYDREWRKLAGLQNFDPFHGNAALHGIPFPPAPLPGIDDIQPIDSAAAFVEEARTMSHCVLSYAWRVAEGDTYLYRVMIPERATLLIGYCGTSWRMEELAGVRNQPVSSATEALVESWLRRTQAPSRND